MLLVCWLSEVNQLNLVKVFTLAFATYDCEDGARDRASM